MGGSGPVGLSHPVGEGLSKMIPTVAFYIFSTVLLVSAVMVVVSRNVFTCALYLAGALCAVAALFALLGADFLFAVQVLLYVGGIMVILIFGVMLSSVHRSRLVPQVNRQWLPSLAVSLVLAGITIPVLLATSFPEPPVLYGPTTERMGRLLLGEMVLPFEVVSLVLIVSLVGAVLFSRKDDKNVSPEGGGG